MKTKQIKARDIRIGMNLENEQRNSYKKVTDITPGMIRGTRLLHFSNDDFGNVFPDDIYFQVI